MENKKQKIIIVDDHPIYVEGLEFALADSFYIQVVATFTDPTLAIKYLETKHVDIAIVDVNMPVLNGFGLMKQIQEREINTQVLFVSVLKDYISVARAYKSGAAGYMSKDAPLLELFKCLETIRQGERYIPPSNESILIEGLLQKDNPDIKPLSPQELVVLRKICEERSSDQIAVDLNISRNTVNNHRKSILKKTGSSSSVALIKYAIVNGLL